MKGRVVERRLVLIKREHGRAVEIREDGSELELPAGWLQLDEVAEWQAYRRQQDEESGR